MVVPSGPAADGLEADVRPGHFAGMLTVVAKLLGITVPDVALFGEKDYQQLVLISTMAADLNMDVEIRPVPTSREADGLARSSRNIYLSGAERAAAAAIPRSLTAAQGAAQAGGSVADVRAAAAAELFGLDVDYLAVRAPDLGEAPARGRARLLVAARLGTTRLLDNCALELMPS
jgi:pantoate--beta-alanine ligase